MNEADLIDLIYKAAQSEEWQSIAIALHQAMTGTASGNMYRADLEAGKTTLAVHSGYIPDMLATCDRARRGSAPGTPALADTPAGDMRPGMEFHDDRIRVPKDGVPIFDGERQFTCHDGNLPCRERGRREGDWLRLMERIDAHLRKAQQLQLMLQEERLVRRGYLDLIDRMENGILLLDARGRVEFRNRAASCLLDDGKLLHVDGAGILRLNDAGADETLRAGITAISRKVYSALPNAFPVCRADITCPFVAMLTPFAASRGDTVIASGFGGDRLPVAVLAIEKRRIRAQPGHDMLGTVFGLTPAEAELALALHAGASLRTHASRRAVSLHTVRNQLKSVFEKTGVHRQAELVSMLGRLVP